MKKTAYILAGLLSLMFCTSPQMRQNQALTAQAQPAPEPGAVTDEAFFENGAAPDATAKKREVEEENPNRGYASWYGRELHGKPTASGELFDMNKHTAAHREFPMGSLVMVKNLENDKKQLVKINDRGPYVDGRIIDLSYASAKQLGFADKGVAKVEIELVQAGEDNFISKAALVEEKENEEAIVSGEDEEEALADEDDEDETPVKKNKGKDKLKFIGGKKPKGYTIQVGAFKKLENAERHRYETFF